MLSGERDEVGGERYPEYNSRKPGRREEGGAAAGRCIILYSSPHLAACQALAAERRLASCCPVCRVPSPVCVWGEPPWRGHREDTDSQTPLLGRKTAGAFTGSAWLGGAANPGRESELIYGASVGGAQLQFSWFGMQLVEDGP